MQARIPKKSLYMFIYPWSLVWPACRFLFESADVGDTRTALQTVMEADVKMSQLLQREALLTTADDSRELRDARVALALTNSQMKRTDAEKLGRLVDRTGAGRAGETRYI